MKDTIMYFPEDEGSNTDSVSNGRKKKIPEEVIAMITEEIPDDILDDDTSEFFAEELGNGNTLADTITASATDRSAYTHSSKKAENEKRQRSTALPKWPIYALICAAVLIVLAVMGVFFLKPTAQPLTDVKISAADSISCVEKAAVSHGLGTVNTSSIALKKLDQEKTKADADPRSSYAVNAALKDTWKTEPVEQKVVYLTFDDGPSSQTPRVLEILDRYNAKATFFVTAQYPDSFGYIKEAYDKGHTIGLHTASHNYADVYYSDAAYFADLDRIGAIVKSQIGYVPAFMRFPGGASNTISANYSKGIMSRLSDQLLAKGYQYYDWNASSGDGGTVNRDQAYNNAIKGNGQDYVVIL